MAIMPDAEGFLYLTSHAEAPWSGPQARPESDVPGGSPGPENGEERDAAGGATSTGRHRPLLGIRQQ